MWPALPFCSGQFGFASRPQPDTPHDVLLFLLQNHDVEDAMEKGNDFVFCESTCVLCGPVIVQVLHKKHNVKQSIG